MAARTSARNRRARTPKKAARPDGSTNVSRSQSEAGVSSAETPKESGEVREEALTPLPVKEEAAEEPVESAEGAEPAAPARTLRLVLDTLGLSYDESVGLLQGDAMFEVPELKDLEGARTLLAQLLDQLQEAADADSQTLETYAKEGFGTQIKQKQEQEEKEDGDIGMSSAEPGEKEAEVEKPSPQQVSEPRRHTIIKISGAPDGEKIRIRTETVATDDDEDIVAPPLKKRRRSIIVTANGERREITPTIDESEEDVEVEEEEEEKDVSEDVVKIEPISTAIDGMPAVQPADADNPGFMPSVYANKPPPNLPIKEMLEPALAQLQLYDDTKAREESSSEHEYLKKKLAVADFPESDLKDQLPGEIPTKDLSVNRPTNPVAFSSFQNYVDPFFRDFTEEDVTFLHQRAVLSNHLPNDYDDQKVTFRIPRLGPLYSDILKEQDTLSAAGNDLAASDLDTIRQLAQKKMVARMDELVGARGSTETLDNTALEGEEAVSCGPLTSRVLAALVGEDSFQKRREEEREEATGVPAFEDLTDVGPEGSSSELPGENGVKVPYTNTDYQTLDERMKRELRYIGVYMNVQQTLNDPGFEQDWVQNKEDDEVCREMRRLQEELKEVQKRNIRRKKVLIPIVQHQIAWQEYMSVVEDLNKQVEQHYRRRINVTPKRNRKRPHHKEQQPAPGQSLKEETVNHLVNSASFQGLLAKRAKWIEKIGPLFKSEREMRQMPQESIFKSMSPSEEEEENEGEEGEEADDEDVLGAHKNDDDVQGQSLEVSEHE